jgi:hypothetical protein
MSTDSTRRLNAVFRASVVIGCVALLLGVAGVYHFGRKDREARVARPADVAVVLLSGAGDAAGVEVVARWHSPGGRVREERGIPGREPASWRFRAAPEGVPLELLVYGRGSVLLSRQPAILTHGGAFEMTLPAR